MKYIVVHKSFTKVVCWQVDWHRPKVQKKICYRMYSFTTSLFFTDWIRRGIQKVIQFFL